VTAGDGAVQKEERPEQPCGYLVNAAQGVKKAAGEQL